MTTAFLIEGIRKVEAQQLPENLACSRLARANGGLIFDVIEFYSPAHLSAVLRTLPEHERPLLAVLTYLDFAAEGSADDIIKKVISPAFKQFADEEGTVYPSWLENLNVSTLISFIEQQFQIHFAGSSEAYTQYADDLHKKMITISNQLSSDSFIDFLRKNPDVDNVQALIGSLHTHFLDNISGFLIINEEEHSKKLSITCDGRAVLVSLYHGEHRDMRHFEKMQETCRELGLTIPETENSRDNEMSEISIAALLTALAKSNRVGLFSALQREAKRKTSATNHVFDIDKASKKFDFWMKNYSHSADTPDQESFVNWLRSDNGGELIDSYTDFCKLAERLTQMGYHLSPPPTETEFNAGIQEYNSSMARPCFWEK